MSTTSGVRKTKMSNANDANIFSNKINILEMLMVLSYSRVGTCLALLDTRDYIWTTLLKYISTKTHTAKHSLGSEPVLLLARLV